MEINYDLLSKISLATQGQKIDKYMIYALCVIKSNAKTLWTIKEARSEMSIISKCVGEEFPDFLSIFKYEKLDYYVFRFNETVWCNLRSYASIMTPMYRILLSCEIGIAGKLAKHLVLGTESTVCKSEWGIYLRSFMDSTDVQIRTLLADIAAATPQKADYTVGISRMYNGADYYEPYMGKLRWIARNVKMDEVEVKKNSKTSDFVKGW